VVVDKVARARRWRTAGRTQEPDGDRGRRGDGAVIGFVLDHVLAAGVADDFGVPDRRNVGRIIETDAPVRARRSALVLDRQLRLEAATPVVDDRVIERRGRGNYTPLQGFEFQ